MISYCTSIKNRIKHFKKTSKEIIESFEVLKKEKNIDIEWCICDYDSDDGIFNFIEKLKPKLKKINFKYKKINFRQYFHHSRAKNIAHKMASGDILVNLDADNILRPAYHKKIEELFAAGANCVWPGINEMSNGGGIGRIAIDRQTFYKIQGYDEKIFNWGSEDLDIIKRCKLLNLNVQTINSEIVEFIKHSDEFRFANTLAKSREESGPLNRKYVLKKILNNEIVANIGATWGI